MRSMPAPATPRLPAGLLVDPLVGPLDPGPSGAGTPEASAPRIAVVRSGEIRVRLERGPAAPAQARAAIRSLARRLDAETFDRVVLVVSELVSNSVRHASLAPGERIQVRVRAGRTVRGEVVDRGEGFRPLPAPCGSLETGRGLRIIERVTDRWGIERGGGATRVWFEIAPRRRTRLRRLAAAASSLGSGPRRLP